MIMQDPVTVQFSQEFDGRFFFTNWSDEDFSVRWNKVEYVFPANKTSPILIPSESLEGIQNIRKAWAEQLAEREYLKSSKISWKAGGMEAKPGEGESMHAALAYIPLVKNRQTGEWDERSPLAPLAMKCLEPLPMTSAKVNKIEQKEVRLRGNSKVLNANGTEAGEAVGESLIGNGTVVA